MVISSCLCISYPVLSLFLKKLLNTNADLWYNVFNEL